MKRRVTSDKYGSRVQGDREKTLREKLPSLPWRQALGALPPVEAQQQAKKV